MENKKNKVRKTFTLDVDKFNVYQKYCNENCMSMSSLIEKLIEKELKSKGIKLK